MRKRRKVSRKDQAARQRSAAARMLSKLGAAKGGRSRAAQLTPAERSKIARRAARARWAKRAA